MSLDAVIAKLKHRIEPYYYVIDETGFFSKYFLEALKKKYISKSTSENLRHVYAKDFNLNDLLDDIKTVTMFSPKRLFICEQSHELNKAQSEVFLTFLTDFSFESNCIVFLAVKKNTTSLLSHCQKNNRLLEFKKPYDSQMQPWLGWMSKNVEKKIDYKAGQLILEKIGNDLNMLDNEIQKLALFVGKRPEIQEEDVRSLLYATRSHSIFELLNAVGARDKKNTLQVLHRMLEEGESEIFIFTMLLRHLRQIWKSIEWMEVKSESDIQKELGIHPFFWNDFRKQRDRNMKTSFEKIWEKAKDLDVVLKSQSVDKKQFLVGWVNSLS